jgi:hypothetical protein
MFVGGRSGRFLESKKGTSRGAFFVEEWWRRGGSNRITRTQNQTRPRAMLRPAATRTLSLITRPACEIHALFVSPHDENEWGNDILGRDTLPDGGTIDIKFRPKEKAQHWDIRVEDADGNFIVWEKLNLHEISTVRLNYKDGKATAFVE